MQAGGCLRVKEVYPKMKIVNPNLYDFLSPVENQRHFEGCFSQ